MIYLLLSIISSSLIFVVFRCFSRFGINNLQAIVVNYFIACICGLLTNKSEINITSLIKADWFYYAVALGSFFILVFNLMAVTTQKSGLSVVSVATKMSFILPILFGIIYYKDSLSTYKLLGIIFAIFAVYFTATKPKDLSASESGILILPVLVFFGNGTIDITIKYLEESFLSPRGLQYRRALWLFLRSIHKLLRQC